MADRELGTMKRQTVVIDGETYERTVRHASQYATFKGYRELGFVKVKGSRYMVERTFSFGVYGEEYRNLSWTVVEGQDPVKRERRADFLTADEKAWLDKAVEWMLKEEYGPRKAWSAYSTKPYMTLDGVTPTSLAYNLFDNFCRWGVERSVGEEAPKKVAEAWNVFDLYKNRWVSQVTSSLKRLKTAGKVFTMYGNGSRGREARVYAHQDYYND